MKKKKLLRLIESLKEDVDFLANRINAMEERIDQINRGGVVIPGTQIAPPFDVTCAGAGSAADCNIPAIFPTTSPVRRLGKQHTGKVGEL